MLSTAVIAIYLIALTGLALYGALGFITLLFYWRHRHRSPQPPQLPAGESWPPITIQIPTYNERYVVEQAIAAAVRQDYPPHLLEIQVVDDSTDDTTTIAAESVAAAKRRGINIVLLHRQHRQGYKAGALAEATKQATGDFIAIFDADFLPEPGFLKDTVPYFLHNERLGLIQTRWGHLNDQSSSLTAAQAIAIDKHFVIEQTVRHRADLYPKFNGTAGIWRRACIEEAGGWQADTVCEDLCLSTRAVLQGWEFNFLPNVVTPGELPTTMAAYRNQQARWAKGSFQCLRKFGWAILSDRNHPWWARLYALLSMSGYLVHPLLIVIILLQIPLIIINYPLPAELIIFSLLGLSQPLLFVLSQQLTYRDWSQRLRHFPTLLLISLGLGPAITRALAQTFLSRQHPFVRTPKGITTLTERRPGYRFRFDRIIFIDVLLAVYAAAGIFCALWLGVYAPVMWLLFCFTGFAYVSYLEIRQ